MITSVHMKADRTTIHVARPSPEEQSLLRLLSPAEKLQAMLAAARAKAARIGGIDSPMDSQKGGKTGDDGDGLAHQDGE